MTKRPLEIERARQPASAPPAAATWSAPNLLTSSFASTATRYRPADGPALPTSTASRFESARFASRQDRVIRPDTSAIPGDRVTDASPAANSPIVQRQASSGAEASRFESEANAVSDHVAAGRPAATRISPVTPGLLAKANTIQRDTAESQAPGALMTPTASQAIALKGPGTPLDPVMRTTLENQLGADLSQVRVHDDEAAHAAARDLDARAFTHGSDIWLGPGASPHDMRLMAHEATHVVQQRGGAALVQLAPARPSTAIGKNASFVIVPVAGTADPLDAYAAIRDRLSPSDWNALNAAARRRTDTVASGQAPPVENELVKPEVVVTVDDLFQPRVTQSKRSGGDQWLRDVFARAQAGGTAADMSARIQDEILYRWLNANPFIMNDSVTIALVDPEGKAGGTGSLLSFSLRGRPLPTLNGLLTIAIVDKSIDGTLDQSLQQMSGELNILAATISKVDAAKARLKAARDLATQDHAKIAAQALEQVDADLRKTEAELAAIVAKPFSELAEPVRGELSSFLKGEFAACRKADVVWRATHPRSKSEYERMSESIEKTEKEDKENPSAWNKLYIIDAARMQGYQNLATGGAPEHARQLGKAYDAGLISYESWAEGVAKAEHRGQIFAGVTLALTLATFGLGIYFEPVTLGGIALFGATTGLVVATGPMLASNFYTSYTDFADPTLQGWWKGTAYSGRDIAVAGLLGAGLGAALPVAGKVLGGLQSKGALAVAALEAGATLPDGVVARTVSKGVVDLAIESEGVTIRVTQAGYRVIGRAGNNASVVLEEGVWPAELAGDSSLGQGARFDIAHPNYPSSVAFGQRGWAMISPQSKLPVQFGVWPELALPAAPVAQPAATASPLLIDAASGMPVTAIAGSDSTLVLAGANLPQGLPQAPPPLWEAGFRPPYMLGPGPQPYGLLTAPPPDIAYVGPLVPQSFEQSLTQQWGTAVAQRGTSMLPYGGEGSVWVRMPSGEWGLAYYPSRPGGVPASSLVTYGVNDPAFLVDAPGANLSAFVQPRPGGSYPGPRNFPMATNTMFDALTGMTHGRGHRVPHAATPRPGPGQMLATADPRNFVAHPRKYNEWIRNNLEQMLKREGATYTAHDIVGPNPRVTSGGYLIPEAELFVQYGPTGAPVRAWRFPLAANPAYYETLTGSFKDVLPQFRINLTDVPVTPVRR